MKKGPRVTGALFDSRCAGERLLLDEIELVGVLLLEHVE